MLDLPLMAEYDGRPQEYQARVQIVVAVSIYSLTACFFRCTNPMDWGCERRGTRANVLNPITSARIRTVDSFSFCYGKVEVRAKVPAGDWLWPGE
jgi:hypothetical protein